MSEFFTGNSAPLKGEEGSLSRSKEEEVDVTKKYHNGQTVLHIAARQGKLQEVQKCIKNNANINEKDNNSQTPLHLASQNNHLVVVLYLLNLKISQDIKTGYVNNQDKSGRTSLHLAAEHGNLNVVKCLVNEGSADVRVKDHEGKTPLYLAVQYDNREIVEFLKSKKADINIQDNEGKTPLHWARQCNKPDIEAFLKRLGARVDVKDNNHRTPPEYPVDGKIELMARTLNTAICGAIGISLGWLCNYVYLSNYSQNGIAPFNGTAFSPSKNDSMSFSGNLILSKNPTEIPFAAGGGLIGVVLSFFTEYMARRLLRLCVKIEPEIYPTGYDKHIRLGDETVIDIVSKASTKVSDAGITSSPSGMEELKMN